MRIGLFGGSFNPPHMGHSLLCHYLLETTDLEQVWLIPTFQHAFSKVLVPYEERLTLCRLLAEPFGLRVQLCELERDREGPSYTIDTVRILRSRHPEHQFDWIVGADILQETHKWRDFEALTQLVHFRVFGREGFPGGSTVAMPEISSTEIRRRLAIGAPVEELLPRRVLTYIEARGLYRAQLPEEG